MNLVPIDHPALVAVCLPLGPGALSQAADMAERMLKLVREHRAVGLAANQVGLPFRMFVACSRVMRRAKLAISEEVFINPVLRFHDSATCVAREACLSDPGLTYRVRRHRFAEIEAMRLDGSVFTLRAGGIAARCWQHEVDHLDGIRLRDRAERLGGQLGGAA